MTILGLAIWFGVAMTALALLMTLNNLRLYRPPPRALPPPGARLSVCIPARNEEANIEACVRSLLANTGADAEVLVYDDQSDDATPDILVRLADADPRVRTVETVPLPEGWNGKQHACWRLSLAAHGRWLLFTDADVRFEPDALSRSVALAESSGVGLLSTFPRQLAGSWPERAVVPMILFVLFSYLPMGKMRRGTSPSASAGCGQFLLVRRDAYDASGGHAAFRDSMHDGIRLPRAVRRAGFRTDLFDATALCRVRMYRGLRQTWRGFAKNAYEGLGSVWLLLFLTLTHACGHVLPWVLLCFATVGEPSRWTVHAAACIALTMSQRLVLAQRFAHSPAEVALHPVGVAMMTLIQWHSLVLHLTRRREWKGRPAPGNAA